MSHDPLFINLPNITYTYVSGYWIPVISYNPYNNGKGGIISISEIGKYVENDSLFQVIDLVSR